MSALRSLAILSFAVAAACPAGAAEGAERVPVAFSPARTLLVLIPGADATQALSEHQPAGIDAGSAAERELLRDCANGEIQRPQATKGFFLTFVLQSWRVLLHPLSVA